MIHNLLNQGFLVEANDIQILHSPQEYTASLLDLIKNAKQRILINCLYLENDESGELIMSALKDAVTKNPFLTVDIFLDYHRALRSRIGQEKKLSNANWYFQQLADFNQKLRSQYILDRDPINVYGVPCNGRELFGVYHVKGLVVDDQVLYTGASINNNYCAYQTYRQDRYQLITSKRLADSFYHFALSHFTNTRFTINQSPSRVSVEVTVHDPNHKVTATEQFIPASDHIDELQAQVLPPEFNSVVANFAGQEHYTPLKSERQLFRSFRTKYLYNSNLQYLRTIITNKLNDILPEQVVMVPLFGVGKDCLLNKVILAAISDAQQSLTIYTPYFNFTKKLIRLIQRKCQAGVKVTIIVSDKVANDFYNDPNDEKYSPANSLPYLYEMNLRKFVATNQQYLDKGNLEIYLWSHDNNSYHAKGIAIDDHTYFFTGSNLNQRSFNVDAENALLCYDPYKNLQQKMADEFAYFKQHMVRVTSPEQIETRKDYPKRVRSTIKRASLFFIDKLAKRLF